MNKSIVIFTLTEIIKMLNSKNPLFHELREIVDLYLNGKDKEVVKKINSRIEHLTFNFNISSQRKKKNDERILFSLEINKTSSLAKALIREAGKEAKIENEKAQGILCYSLAAVLALDKNSKRIRKCPVCDTYFLERTKNLIGKYCSLKCTSRATSARYRASH